MDEFHTVVALLDLIIIGGILIAIVNYNYR